jgi:CHAT domain-containing protein
MAHQGSVLKALDFEASRATATSAELSQYRILRIASHELINSRHPESSGVVLSLVDRQGHSQNGFLQAHEIYNLKLNADLVVLSACRTALGKDVRGEGLIGLTRGFMYAGAPRVVASLWRVPDHATGELMQRFYERILGRGLRPRRRCERRGWNCERRSGGPRLTIGPGSSSKASGNNVCFR